MTGRDALSVVYLLILVGWLAYEHGRTVERLELATRVRVLGVAPLAGTMTSSPSSSSRKVADA